MSRVRECNCVCEAEMLHLEQKSAQGGVWVGVLIASHSAYVSCSG